MIRPFPRVEQRRNVDRFREAIRLKAKKIDDVIEGTGIFVGIDPSITILNLTAYTTITWVRLDISEYIENCSRVLLSVLHNSSTTGIILYFRKWDGTGLTTPETQIGLSFNTSFPTGHKDVLTLITNAGNFEYAMDNAVTAESFAVYLNGYWRTN